MIAYHLTWTAYGWWLPNDPRGSGSHFVAQDVLADLGELHYGRKRIQPSRAVVHEFYERAAERLHYPLLQIDAVQREIVGTAFGEVIADQGYTCYACAIMPDHVHLLIRKHRHHSEKMMEFLQDQSRSRLIELGHRSKAHPTWTAGHGWVVYLNTPDEIRRTIRYIEDNPIKIGLPKQTWLFVKSYDGWPLHRRR